MARKVMHNNRVVIPSGGRAVVGCDCDPCGSDEPFWVNICHLESQFSLSSFGTLPFELNNVGLGTPSHPFITPVGGLSYDLLVTFTSYTFTLFHSGNQVASITIPLPPLGGEASGVLLWDQFSYPITISVTPDNEEAPVCCPIHFTSLSEFDANSDVDKINYDSSFQNVGQNPTFPGWSGELMGPASSFSSSFLEAETILFAAPPKISPGTTPDLCFETSISFDHQGGGGQTFLLINTLFLNDGNNAIGVVQPVITFNPGGANILDAFGVVSGVVVGDSGTIRIVRKCFGTQVLLDGVVVVSLANAGVCNIPVCQYEARTGFRWLTASSGATVSVSDWTASLTF